MYYRRGRHAVESITITIIVVVVVVVVIMLLLELTSVDSENVTQYVISPPTTCAPLLPPHPGQSAPHAHTHIAPVNQAATDKYSPIFYSSWTTTLQYLCWTAEHMTPHGHRMSVPLY